MSVLRCLKGSSNVQDSHPCGKAIVWQEAGIAALCLMVSVKQLAANGPPYYPFPAKHSFPAGLKFFCQDSIISWSWKRMPLLSSHSLRLHTSRRFPLLRTQLGLQSLPPITCSGGSMAWWLRAASRDSCLNSGVHLLSCQLCDVEQLAVSTLSVSLSRSTHLLGF